MRKYFIVVLKVVNGVTKYESIQGVKGKVLREVIDGLTLVDLLSENNIRKYGFKIPEACEKDSFYKLVKERYTDCYIGIMYLSIAE